VDGLRCEGHALCAALAGDVYEVNENDGRNEMGEFDVPDALGAIARQGAAACPERAISLDEPDDV
jgi:ferredoxin